MRKRPVLLEFCIATGRCLPVPGISRSPSVCQQCSCLSTMKWHFWWAFAQTALIRSIRKPCSSPSSSLKLFAKSWEISTWKLQNEKTKINNIKASTAQKQKLEVSLTGKRRSRSPQRSGIEFRAVRCGPLDRPRDHRRCRCCRDRRRRSPRGCSLLAVARSCNPKDSHVEAQKRFVTNVFPPGFSFAKTNFRPQREFVFFIFGEQNFKIPRTQKKGKFISFVPPPKKAPNFTP